ncbi:MAG: ComF family protein [Stenotrophobium sp.]
MIVDYFLGRQRCIYCGESCGRLPICAGCENGLPWNACACPGCARPQTHAAPCPDCLQHSPLFDSAWTAFRLEPPVQQGVHALKYHAGFLHAGLLGELMAQRLARRAQPMPQLIVPVPLHHTRLMLRGYNQALELARGLRRVLDVEVDARAAQRVRATPDQIGLSKAERRRNLKSAFAVSARVADLHIALLDDVMTTGATLAELARAARKAGAVKIEVWALARAG